MPAKDQAAAAAPQEGVLEVNEFDKLLETSFKPKTDEARSAVKSAVQVLAEEALKGTAVRRDDALTYIEDVIAEIDRKISKQLNLVMHHADFTKMEGSWRGLNHLVFNTETDTMLKIKVMNISKKDLHRTMKSFKGAAWDQSPIFKKMYEEEFGTPGGVPFGAMVGDFEFDHSAQDVECLRDMSKIAATAPLSIHHGCRAPAHADGHLAGT